MTLFRKKITEIVKYAYFSSSQSNAPLFSVFFSEYYRYLQHAYSESDLISIFRHAKSDPSWLFVSNYFFQKVRNFLD